LQVWFDPQQQNKINTTNFAKKNRISWENKLAHYFISIPDGIGISD
jgi:hypothetical protein